MRGVSRLILLVVLLLSALPARADEGSIEAAKRAFEAGDQAYEAGHYLTAARAYERAYELYPLPGITFSMAQAYRRHYFEDEDVHWLELAQSLYRRYLEEEPNGSRRAHAVTHLGDIALLIAHRSSRDAPLERATVAPLTELLVSSSTPDATASIDGGEPERVPVVREVTAGSHRIVVAAPGFVEAALDVLALEGRLSIVPKELEPRPGGLVVLGTEGADVWVDGQVMARTPMREAVSLGAGPHEVFVSKRGRKPTSRSVDIERGEVTTWTVDLPATGQRVAALVTLGASGAFAIFGAAMAILAGVSEAEVNDARAGLSKGQPLTPAEAARSNDALARRDLARGLSLGGLGLSAAAGVTGALVFVLDMSSPGTGKSGTTAGLRFLGTF